MFDIVAGSAAAVTACKSLIELIGAAKDAKAKEAASQLYGQLCDIRIEASNLKVENNDLRQDVARLKAELDRAKTPPADKLERKGEMFYRLGDDAPFCPTCYQKDGKTIYATAYQGDHTPPHGKWHCQICKGFFEAEKVQHALPSVGRMQMAPPNWRHNR